MVPPTEQDNRRASQSVPTFLAGSLRHLTLCRPYTESNCLHSYLTVSQVSELDQGGASAGSTVTVAPLTKARRMLSNRPPL